MIAVVMHIRDWHRVLRSKVGSKVSPTHFPATGLFQNHAFIHDGALHPHGMALPPSSSMSPTDESVDLESETVVSEAVESDAVASYLDVSPSHID